MITISTQRYSIIDICLGSKDAYAFSADLNYLILKGVLSSIECLE